MSIIRRKAKVSGLNDSLLTESQLRLSVKSGLRAAGVYSERIDDSAKKVTESLDFDKATMRDTPEANRWDYFLFAKSLGIVGVEVHSAKESEVNVVIAKRRHSKPAFEAHLKEGKTVVRWVWVASGKVKFLPGSRYALKLAKHRIEFAGRNLKL